MYGVEGPVWLPANAPARALYPPSTAERRAKVLFLGASAANATGNDARMGAAGSLSRAVPLFLAESAFVLLGLDTIALLPWSAERGFALLSSSWSEEDAAFYAQSAGAYLCVVVHVVVKPEAAHLTVRLLSPQAEDAGRETKWSGEVAWERPEGALAGLWARLAGHLVAAWGDAPVPPKAQRYGLPRGAAFPLYLHLLEQLSGLRCQGSEAPGAGALPGQHASIRNALQLAHVHAESLPVRLLLHEALLRMRDLDVRYTEGLRAEVKELHKTARFPDGEACTILEQQLRMIYPE